jgi:hypothetical protein
MSRELLAAVVMVWLTGALVGWCVGWAARSEQNRAWHAGLRHQLQDARDELEQLHAELADALDALDLVQAESWPSAHVSARVPAVVQVNYTTTVPPTVSGHLAVLPPTSGCATPVLPAQGDQS